MSDVEDDLSEEEQRVGNAFSGLNLSSSSESEDESDVEEVDDKKVDDELEKRITSESNDVIEDLDSGDSEDSEVDADGSEFTDEEGAETNEISEFSDLVGRSTRGNGVISQDIVDGLVGIIGEGLRPTEIQRLCWTSTTSEASAFRDIVAISKTGSGKTLAFLLPLLCTIAASRPPRRDDPAFIYPKALVIAPTRVLAQQIFDVASKLVASCPSLEVGIAVVLGGVSYNAQMEDLLASHPALVVATPGRFADLCGLTSGGSDTDICIKVDDVCEVVIDEADMMLDLGFQEVLSSIALLVNRKSQDGFRYTVTSATWTNAIASRLALFESLSNQPPILLTIDGAGQSVPTSVTQRVEVLAHKGAPRFKRLLGMLKPILAKELRTRVIVFCLTKAETKQIGKDLAENGVRTVVLQGDMSQTARTAAIEAFRSGRQGRVLVATDVAARGLDVLSVSHVFNYSLGLSIESYIHRCGRTGRAGQFGVAHTFVVKGDEKNTPELCKVLSETKQVISDDLRIMADKEVKKRLKVASGNANEGMDEDMALEEELRRENREKQLSRNKQRQAGGKKGQRRRGKR
mmetsp:Transcript_21741/g.38414  ORF Transcript_21741/g.38414 Transcript_21741/m.38414 type:complete len:575 (-) Transcript_21741:12-1736(-)